MKTSWKYGLSLLGIARCARSQSLLEAISTFPELSNFTALMTDNPGLAGALLTSNASSLTSATTVLVPDNSAFTKLSALYRLPMGNLTVTQLEPYLQYHLLVGEVLGENLTAPEGVTVPTYLTAELYNNRSAGDALGSSGAEDDPNNGQVVYLQTKAASAGGSRGRKFVVRQLQDPTVNAQGGLGHQINLTAVDGVWDGGYFQIVDKFLSLPLNCTESIRRWNMTAFRQSLDRTGLGAPLDITRNVTCLTPNDNAFAEAGSPNVTANVTELDRLLRYHTIAEPLYSNFLEDGQTYTTFSNDTIRIRIVDGDIFFNDARVLNKNVMTNNGLMYVLDRIMTPLSGEDASNSTSTSSSTPSTTRAPNPLDTTTPTPSDTVASASSSAVAGVVVPPASSSVLWTILALLSGIVA